MLPEAVMTIALLFGAIKQLVFINFAQLLRS